MLVVNQVDALNSINITKRDSRLYKPIKWDWARLLSSSILHNGADVLNPGKITIFRKDLHVVNSDIFKEKTRNIFQENNSTSKSSYFAVIIIE